MIGVEWVVSRAGVGGRGWGRVARSMVGVGVNVVGGRWRAGLMLADALTCW